MPSARARRRRAAPPASPARCCGAKPTWMWSAWSASASVFGRLGVRHEADDLVRLHRALERQQAADRRVGDRAGALVAEDRRAVDRGDVDGVAAAVLGDVARRGQPAVAALQRADRRAQAGHREQLQRREHAAVDAPGADVLAPAGIDRDPRVGEHEPLERLLAEQHDLADRRLAGRRRATASPRDEACRSFQPATIGAGSMRAERAAGRADLEAHARAARRPGARRARGSCRRRRASLGAAGGTSRARRRRRRAAGGRRRSAAPAAGRPAGAARAGRCPCGAPARPSRAIASGPATRAAGSSPRCAAWGRRASDRRSAARAPTPPPRRCAGAAAAAAAPRSPAPRAGAACAGWPAARARRWLRGAVGAGGLPPAAPRPVRRRRRRAAGRGCGCGRRRRLARAVARRRRRAPACCWRPRRRLRARGRGRRFGAASCSAFAGAARRSPRGAGRSTGKRCSSRESRP